MKSLLTYLQKLFDNVYNNIINIIDSCNKYIKKLNSFNMEDEEDKIFTAIIKIKEDLRQHKLMYNIPNEQLNTDAEKTEEKSKPILPQSPSYLLFNVILPSIENSGEKYGLHILKRKNFKGYKGNTIFMTLDGYLNTIIHKKEEEGAPSKKRKKINYHVSIDPEQKYQIILYERDHMISARIYDKIKKLYSCKHSLSLDDLEHSIKSKVICIHCSSIK